MATLQTEKFEDVIDEIKSLLDEHWAEIARHRDKIKLDPDYEKYQAMADAGVLHVITLRVEGVLAGYFVTMVMPNLHYKQTIMSYCDILFIRKEHRGKWLGIKMFLYAERVMKDLGVEVIHIGMKLAQDFGPMLERIGYTEIDRTLEKYIGKG